MTHARRLLLALVLILAALALRAPTAHRVIWNLDEGITASIAELILVGEVPYRDAADQRTPLVPFLKAGIFTVTGHWNTTAVHLVLALLLGLAAVGLWQLARRLGDEPTGIAAAVVFTALCFLLPETGDAMAAHTEWFLLLFSLAAFLTFATAIDRPGFWRGLGTGALFGLAFLCKQPGLLDFAVSLVLLAILITARPGARAAFLRMALGNIAGFGLVGTAMVAYFAWHDATRDLIYYAWTYNSAVYVHAVPLSQRLLTMGEPFRLAWNHIPVTLALGLVGALALPVVALGGLRRRPTEIRLLPWLALGWTAAGIVAASLSGRAFSHYSIQVISGLSLVVGWVLVQAWHWCSARNRAWRLAAAGLLVLASADTGTRLVSRFLSLEPVDEAKNRLQIVRAHTRPSDRIFAWGYTPEYYVLARRLPCTRFIYTSFLTGLIPWTNIDPLVDTTATVVPDSWLRLAEDFHRTPPAMIIDTGDVRGNGKYPLYNQAWLWSYITRDYAELIELTTPDSPAPIERFYRRLEPVTPSAVPAEGITDPSVQLQVGSTGLLNAMPTLSLSAPADASRIELYSGNLLFRSAPLAPGGCRVSFFVPEADRAGISSSFRAAVHRPDGVHLGPAVTIPSRHTTPTAAGPTLLYRGRQYQPLASDTSFGPPSLRNASTDMWNATAIARLLYQRPPGLQTLTFTFGLIPSVYFDTGPGTATDGADIVVDFVPTDGLAQRLFVRRLEPKISGSDQGPQTATVTFPAWSPGRIMIQLLPGRNGVAECDNAYLGTFIGNGTDIGPLLAGASGDLFPVEVHANHAPVMTCDPEGKWIAHSPSSVSYETPPSARSLVFSYGLEPASYDGSQGGRTDGITVTVTAEQADGTTTTLFARTLDPANVAGDRGRQTSRIGLSAPAARRVTFAIAPGPHDNVSYDWSYLADLRVE